MSARFTCGICGQDHDLPPRAFALREPYWYSILPTGQRRGAQLGAESCVIRGRWFLLRANVELKLADDAADFIWTIWVALQRADYERVAALWSSPARPHETPCAVELASQLPTYPDTLRLPARLHQRAPGLRPLVELSPGDHPLVQETHAGVSRGRWLAIGSAWLHENPT